MSIPSELQTLITRLGLELEEIEQQATTGIDIVTDLLSRFSNNAILTQYLAYFNAALFFVETSKAQVQTLVQSISIASISEDLVTEVGEDLGSLLGRVLEVRLKVKRLIEVLES